MKKTKEKLILISEKKAHIINLCFNSIITIVFSYLLSTAFVNLKIIGKDAKLFSIFWLILPLFGIISIFEIFRLHTILMFSEKNKK